MKKESGASHALAEALDLGIEAELPRWALELGGDQGEAGDGPSRDDEGAGIIRPLWDSVVRELREHGYSSANERLEDLVRDVERASHAVSVLQDHLKYYRACQDICVGLRGTFGDDTLVLETVKRQGVAQDDARGVWHVGELPYHSEGGVVTRVGARLRLSDVHMEKLRIVHRPNELFTIFRDETWAQAVTGLKVVLRLTIRRLDTVQKEREFADFHAALVHAVLKRERLIGGVAEWGAMTPEAQGDILAGDDVDQDAKDLLAIAEALRKHLDEMGGRPKSEEEVRKVFRNHTRWTTWIGERSSRYSGNGEARHTGRRVLNEAGISLRTRKSGQQHGLLSEVQDMYDLARGD